MTLLPDWRAATRVDTYLRWRDRKLARYPSSADELVVELARPKELTPGEKGRILDLVERCNMAIYTTSPTDDPEAPKKIMAQLGAGPFDINPEADSDGVTRLTPKKEDSATSAFDYIPYSSRAISWHTDGYYNEPEKRIASLILHSVHAAEEGGENQLVDHEMVYMALYDRDPALLPPLFGSNVMTIPARIEGGVTVRPDRSGPVFGVDSEGRLWARYTHRTRSLVWQEGDEVARSVAALRSILDDGPPGMFSVKLSPGMGLIANNVFHTRKGFKEAAGKREERLIYRIRYYGRLGGGGA